MDRFETDLVASLPRLRAFARKLATRDHELVEDLVQEACVNALRARTQFTPGTNMDAWLFTILRNCFLDIVKRASTRLEQADDDLDRLTRGTVPQLGHLEFMALRQAFARLSAEHREVLLLAVLGLLSYQEMALRCRCHVGTVKSRVWRAREKLRQALDEDAPQPRWPTRSTDATTVFSTSRGPDIERAENHAKRMKPDTSAPHRSWSDRPGTPRLERGIAPRSCGHGH